MKTKLSPAEIAVAGMKAIEACDLAAIRSYTHPEAVNREALSEPPACRQPGPEGFYATAQWLHNLAADISWEVHHAVADDDLVAVYATMSGRQSNPHTIYDPDGNPAQVMPNHGRPFAVTQSHWFRIRDQLVVEHWADRDDLGMAMQLGWLEPPAA